MGQIVGLNAKPKRANLNALSLVPTPANGEIILVCSDNSMTSDGQGNFDYHIVGDGKTAATALPLKRINNDSVEYDVITDFTNPTVTYLTPANINFSNDNGTYTYTQIGNGARAFVAFPAGMIDGEYYYFNFTYVKSLSTTYNVNLAQNVNGNAVHNIPMAGTSGSVSFYFQKLSTIKGFYVPSTSLGSGGTLTLSDISVTKRVAVLDIVEKNSSDIEELQSKVVASIDEISDFSAAAVSTYQPAKVTIVNNNGIFTVTSISAGGRAFIAFPNNSLVNGETYTLSFDFTSTSGNTIGVNFANAAGGTSVGSFDIAGTSGHASGEFVMQSGIDGVYFASTSVGAGHTLTISNMLVDRKAVVSDEIGNLDQKIKDTNQNVSNIEDSIATYNAKDGESNEDGVVWSSYTGTPILSNLFGYKVILPSFHSLQGMAISGDICFCVNPGCQKFGWFNVKTRTSGRANDCSFLPSADGGYHANSMAFSEEYYDASDPFPLLYIGNGNSTKPKEILVARISLTGDKYVYSMSLVQTITIPDEVPFCNVAMGDGYLYLVAPEMCYQCNIPNIFDNGSAVASYTMTSSDIVKSFAIPSLITVQDCCYYRGRILITSGGLNSSLLTIVDVNTESTINQMSLVQLGLPNEPEGLSFWGDTPIYSDNSKIYRLWLK